MTKSNSTQLNKLRAQISALEETISTLTNKLQIAKAGIVLPSGMYLEHSLTDNLIIHVPAQRTFHPITLPSDPANAFAVIRRIFHAQRTLPRELGRDSCPTQGTVNDWLKEGGVITTDRKVKAKDIVF